MKRSKQSGATLLEVMLVLAVAAMVVVLSIRYYRSATNSQIASQISSFATAAMAAADNLAMPRGTYAGLPALTTAMSADTSQYVYVAALTAGTPATTQYSMTLTPTTAPPAEACTVAAQQLRANPKVLTSTCNTGTGVITITYDVTK